MEFVIETKIECQKWMTRKDRGWHYDEAARKMIYDEEAEYPKALINWVRKRRHISGLCATVFWSNSDFVSDGFKAYKGESMEAFEKRLMDYINRELLVKTEKSLKECEARLAKLKEDNA